MNLLGVNAMRTRARRERRTGSAGAGRARAQVPAPGFTVIELIVTVTVALLALAIAFPTLNSAHENLGADLQDFSLNLQVARDLGVSRSLHYRVRIATQTAYVLEYQSGGWVQDRSINLRRNMSFAAGDVGKVTEFDTRGGCVSSPLPAFTLTDGARGWSKQVTVNATGMVDHT